MKLLETKEDKENAISVLIKEKEINLFLMNNLKTDDDEIKTYSLGREAFIQVFHNTSVSLYLEGEYDKDEVIKFFKNNNSFLSIKGPERTLKELEYLFPSFVKDYRDMLTIDKSLFKKNFDRDSNLKSLKSKKDFKELYAHYQTGPLKIYENEESWIDYNLNLDFPFEAVGYYVNGNLVSSAYLAAPTKDSAMVVGVYTKKEYEGKHYAQKTVTELVDIALNDDNIPFLCLWYSDEKAKHIYNKIGFHFAGKYANFHK